MRTAVDLRLRGDLRIDTPDFYGVLTGAATVRARVRLGDHTQLMAALDPVTYGYAVDAVVVAAGASVGPATAGVLFAGTRDARAGALFARALLPFDSARRGSVLWGAELGAAFADDLRPRLAVQGGASVVATVATAGGVNHGTVRPGAVLDLAFLPRPWAALAAGAAARFAAAPDARLQALAARLSARAVSRRGLGVALGFEARVAGADRPGGTVTLLGSYTPPARE